MINFLPIDEVKNSDHFIIVLKIENLGNNAKVSQEMGNPYLSPSKICLMKREEDFEANLSGEEGTTEEMKTSWFKRIKKGHPDQHGGEKRNAGRFVDQMSEL